MGILTVVFALCHRSQQSGCKTEHLSLCHPEVNDVITKLSLMDKVYTVYTYLGFQTLLQTSLILPSSVAELMRSVHNSRKSPLTLIRLGKAPLHVVILHTILRKKTAIHLPRLPEQAFMCVCIVTYDLILHEKLNFRNLR